MLLPLPRAWRPVFAPALTVLLTGPTLFAADAPPTATAPDFSAIAPKMQAFVDQGQIAGAVTLVATKDKILHLAAVGKSDLQTGRAMHTDDLFWIASMSKPITAVAVALLVDDGKLSFDDPVGKYIPEYNDLWVTTQSDANSRSQVRPTRPVTLRDLLSHTSGLIDGYPAIGPGWTLAQMAQVHAREPLRFQPGTKWSYSTAGIDAAGRVVEVASGMPYDQFLQQRLFDPLGMKDTSFWIEPQNVARYADTYRLDPSNKLVHEPIPYLYNTLPTDHRRPPLGGAGLFSTAEDIAKFYQMVLSGGTVNGKQILKAETLAEMLRKQTGDLKARAGMPWGLGFCIVEDPTQMEANNMLSPGSYGHGGAFGTNSWVDPKRGIIYVMMLERDKMGNPDNSPMHIEFQKTAAAALGP
jgi:CubicO group peptidase (beta-lactamase class C family)